MAWGSQVWGDCTTWGDGRFLSLANAWGNFVYRIEAIDPACDIVKRKFAAVDRLKMGADENKLYSFGNSSGRARDFTLARIETEEDSAETRSMFRAALHRFELSFAYPTCLGTENEIHEIMDRDRHDVIEALRHQSGFHGTWDDPCAFTGIKVRKREDDRLEDSGAVWVQHFRYRCRIKENAIGG